MDRSSNDDKRMESLVEPNPQGGTQVPSRAVNRPNSAQQANAGGDATMIENAGSQGEHAPSGQKQKSGANLGEDQQISADDNQPGYQRQHTPGAANQDARDRNLDSLLDDDDAKVENRGVKANEEQARPSNAQTETQAQGQPGIAVTQELNPEQALNLTDEDVESLRRLLTEHVSTLFMVALARATLGRVPSISSTNSDSSCYLIAELAPGQPSADRGGAGEQTGPARGRPGKPRDEVHLQQGGPLRGK